MLGYVREGMLKLLVIIVSKLFETCDRIDWKILGNHHVHRFLRHGHGVKQTDNNGLV